MDLANVPGLDSFSAMAILSRCTIERLLSMPDEHRNGLLADVLGIERVVSSTSAPYWRQHFWLSTRLV